MKRVLRKWRSIVINILTTFPSIDRLIELESTIEFLGDNFVVRSSERKVYLSCQLDRYYAKFAAHTAVEVKVPVLWNITPCGMVCRYKRFGGVFWLHLQGCLRRGNCCGMGGYIVYRSGWVSGVADW
jgi:hypothetical protein